MKKLIRPFIAIIGVAALALFIWTATTAFFYYPQFEITFEGAPPLPPDPPERLIIPALNIDTSIQHAGVVAGNRMASPTNYHDVAWYKYGPAPGSLGSAVIAGHLDNGLGLSGVFKNLSQLQPGDEIEVVTETGETRRFVVERLETYPYEEVPSTVFTADDAVRLNLITCSGKWIKTASLGWTVDHRLVVYTKLAS